ncbi:recombination directionality factor [Streptomyces sp. SYSU K217416]
MAPHPYHSPSRGQKLDDARADRPRVSASDPVGRFHVARQQGGRPIAVSAWRITTEDHAVADAVGGLYGGVPQLLDTGDERVVEVLTHRDHIPVLLGGRGAVSLRMVMRGAGETFHVCDGTRFLEPAGARGSLCGCPASLADRKAAAQTGRGPTPEVRIGFRLADLPELGELSLVSTSWELAAELPAFAADLDAAAVPALGVLRYELVEFPTRSGIAVSYRRPVVEVGRTQALAQAAVRLAA